MFWCHDQLKKNQFLHVKPYPHPFTYKGTVLFVWLALDMHKLTSLMAHKQSNLLNSRKGCPPLDASKNSNTLFILQGPELHVASIPMLRTASWLKEVILLLIHPKTLFALLSLSATKYACYSSQLGTGK